jgi:hypothetical protein
MNSSNIKILQIKNENTQKQLNELIKDFNKCQYETKESIKRDIWNKEDNTRYERRTEQGYGKPQKKRIKQILEKKSPLNQLKNTKEGHSSRLEQVEDRISGHGDKIDVKEKKKNS